MVNHVESSLSDETFWCLERTRVILFARQLFLQPKETAKILKYFEDPCHTVFIFVSNSQQLVQWKGSLNDISYESQNLLSGAEIVASIQSLNSINQEEEEKKEEKSMKNIFLFYQNWNIHMMEMVLRELESLNSQPNWDVIIVCSTIQPLFCPITQNISINRVIPIHSGVLSALDNIRDIVKNPDFDRFEYLKYIQIQNRRSRLECLANKTIHLGLNFVSFALLENIALLVQNALVPTTTTSTTKVIFYRTQDEFWDHFMKKNGLANITNFQIVYEEFLEVVWSSLEEKTDDVYVLNDPIGEMREYICTSPKEGRKAFVFYSDISYDGETDRECSAAYRGISNDRNIDSLDEKGNLVEDVLDTSCF